MPRQAAWAPRQKTWVGERPVMKSVLRYGVIAVLLLGGIAGGWYWWQVARFIESTDDAFVQADISAVSPKIQGYVREVRVSDNQLVKAGDVLVVIDDREFLSKLDHAHANVAEKRAAITMLETRRIWQQAVIDQASAAVASAEAELHRADLDFARQRDLFKTDISSRQKFETADADRRKAEAALARNGAAL